ncbi:MAG TPA: penicillin acylase family protein [Alphaproteobacteria bacterium]|nr:penicillin acylase family protein [Alphaproteobacteria bacterium]
MARRRARSRSRILLFALGWILLLAVVAVVGGFVWLRTSLPTVDGTLAVAGLRQPVAITRDPDGIPHIRASSEADAYFALGFVHAQDRLWQMEGTRRVGEGRLAEIVGPLGLTSDRFSRTMGFARLAKANLATLSPDAHAALDAYTAGVNAWIESHRGALPPEFVALRFQPEPWRPEDSLIWGKLMSTRLSNWAVLLLRLRLAAELPPDELADLFPPYPADAPVTVDDAVQQHAANDNDVTRTAPRLHAALPIPGGEADVPAEASNAFVLAGSRTKTGQPLLANDPHLAFDAPNLWYLVRIDAPGLTLAGASVPGVPFLVIGHNGRVGWGFTTTGAETDSLVAEPLDKTKFKTRDEMISVAGQEPVKMTIRRSEVGPVISDVVPVPGLRAGEVAALSAPVLREDDRTFDAFFHLNRAESAEGFRNALREFDSPMQNAFFADVDGHIGTVVAGRIPERAPGTPSGLIRNTSTPSQPSYIPFDDLPQAFDPARGEIVNANNKVIGGNYHYEIASFWPGVERARRIEERLAAAPTFDAPALTSIQTDAVSLGARALMPRLLPFIADAGLEGPAAAARDLLNGWDGTMRRASPEPLIWHAWVAALARSLAATRGHGDEPSLVATIARPDALTRILDAPSRWCTAQPSDEPTDTCRPLVAGAFATAMSELAHRFGNDPARWRWGDAHRAVFANRLFANIPLLDRLTTIDVPTDGDDGTVNRGTVGFGARHGSLFYHPPMYPGIHGPGLRMVLDFSDLDRSLFMQATGQSGNPLSSHYRDLANRWAAGEYVTLGPVDFERTDVHTLRLVPAP